MKILVLSFRCFLVAHHGWRRVTVHCSPFTVYYSLVSVHGSPVSAIPDKSSRRACGSRLPLARDRPRSLRAGHANLRTGRAVSAGALRLFLQFAPTSRSCAPCRGGRGGPQSQTGAPRRVSAVSDAVRGDPSGAESAVGALTG